MCVCVFYSSVLIRTLFLGVIPIADVVGSIVKGLKWSNAPFFSHSWPIIKDSVIIIIFER